MFTGIIEQTGIVEHILISGTNRTFTISSPMSNELKVDQSVSHNGVCLTVEKLDKTLYTVTAIAETLEKTNLDSWIKGTQVNLERCLKFDGRLDGHLVQGHVDTTARCTNYKEHDGSWEFTFSTDKIFAGLMIEKGSVTMNGISLTIFNVAENSFSVAVIPYTYNHTNINKLMIDDKVNIEFDMIGKYVNRIQNLKRSDPA
jgi:riboflavin synthase